MKQPNLKLYFQKHRDENNKNCFSILGEQVSFSTRNELCDDIFNEVKRYLKKIHDHHKTIWLAEYFSARNGYKLPDIRNAVCVLEIDKNECLLFLKLNKKYFNTNEAWNLDIACRELTKEYGVYLSTNVRSNYA